VTVPRAPGAAPLRGIRIDRWLWHARLYKTRTLAARAVAEGHVRVNGARVSKPAAVVAVGDGLTVVQGKAVRVVRVRDLGLRRGPAAEARGLYDDLAAPAEPGGASQDDALPPPGAGARASRGHRALIAPTGLIHRGRTFGRRRGAG
jgi:ribosome-associated heat shock protein Hsp15